MQCKSRLLSTIFILYSIPIVRLATHYGVFFYLCRCNIELPNNLIRGTFDHNDRDLHDSEIEAGADVALVKTLVFLEFKTSFRRKPAKVDMEAITLEISTVLNILECVYR